MPLRLALILGFLILPAKVFAEVEAGVGLGASYLSEEGKLVPSMHLHLTEGMHRLRFGVGLEYISDGHGHGVVSLMLGYEVSEHVLVSYMPGICTREVELVHHLELTASYPLGGLHLGPFVGLGLNDESHVSVGVHLGF